MRVLDPFGGTFSTCAVAHTLGRRTIGIDINKEYFKIGIRRTGITEEYNGEKLMPDKSRKTNNKSKKSRQTEQKEIVAQQAIPLVEQSKTEQEALNKIKQLIKQG